jgi:uncharacterized protein
MRELDTIVALQAARRELREVEARLGGIPHWMQELHAEHSARRGEIDALVLAAADAAAERRAAAGAIAEAQEKQRHYQQQIGLVRTQREYGALLHEIDAVKAQIKGLEEQEFQAMERSEQALRDLDEKRAAFADLDTRYAAELARWEGEKPAVARQVEEVRGRIAELEKHVTPPLLSRFNRVFERRGGDALAPVRLLDRGSRAPQIWACAACNYRVRPQVVVEIRNQGTIIECDSCKRILFLEGG